MNDAIPGILSHLQGLGILRQPWSVGPLSGNADRRPDRARTHLLVSQPDASALKISIGPDLGDARRHTLAFARALPDLTPREAFFVRVGELDVWGVEAVTASVLEDLGENASDAARLLGALDQVRSSLAAIEGQRDDAAFEQEWADLHAAVHRLPCWTADEADWLRRDLLPALHHRLARGTPRRRWTNGDFTSSNIAIRTDGRPVIFDAEFASVSHWLAEETVRFRRISPVCHRHPALLEHWWRPDDAAWELFFQLRQLVLEFRENRDAYLQRVLPDRKSAMRWSGESLGIRFPDSWPASLAPEPRFVGEPVQLFWRDRSTKFTLERSVVAPVRAGVPQLIAFRVPGRHAFWRLDPAASKRPVLVRSLVAVVASRKQAPAVPVEFSVEGAGCRKSAEGWLIEPTGPDPQLHFRLPDEAVGIVAEMQCL